MSDRHACPAREEETKVSGRHIFRHLSQSHECGADNRLVRDVPVDYELGVRVQALESLIRSGSTLDQSSASTAAMETILHATRAAESGSLDASSALAQLTDAMSGNGVGAMTQDAQSSLLMDVLHQVGESLRVACREC